MTDADLCRMAILAYQPAESARAGANDLGFPLTDFVSVDGTEMLVASNSTNDCVVAFRGTTVASLRDWLTNVRFRFTSYPGYGRVHRGFMWSTMNVVEDIDRLLGSHHVIHDHKRLHLVGHSMGGAIAHLAVPIVTDMGIEVETLATFGCPRPGDAEFAGSIDGIPKNVHRWVNNTDIVPHMPLRSRILPSFSYRHVGPATYISTTGRVYDAPGRFYRTCDYIRGLWAGWGDMRIDGLKDHNTNEYLRHIHAAES